MKHSLASEKKYFPTRKRKGKRTATAEGEQEAEADQSTNLLGDTANSTNVSNPAEQSVEDLIGLGAPTTQPAAYAQPTTTDDLLGMGAPVQNS